MRKGLPLRRSRAIDIGRVNGHVKKGEPIYRFALFYLTGRLAPAPSIPIAVVVTICSIAVSAAAMAAIVRVVAMVSVTAPPATLMFPPPVPASAILVVVSVAVSFQQKIGRRFRFGDCWRKRGRVRR